MANLVTVLREARRVLRDDGVAFVVVGDSYIAHPGQRKATDKAGPKQSTSPGSVACASRSSENLPAKSLALVPQRLAIALQVDGWIVRSLLIWAKGASGCPTWAGSVMPSSDPTKPTPAHEYILYLTKQGKYWSDWYACRERGAEPERQRNDRYGGASWKERQQHGEGFRATASPSRNIRTVWAAPPEEDDGFFRDVLAVSPKGSKLPHYALFPEALVTPLVRAGCPTRTCSVCGRALRADGREEAGGRRISLLRWNRASWLHPR